MYFEDRKVLRPEKTKTQTKNNTTYVYAVIGQTYKKDKKYAVDKRVSIGKMIDDKYMKPNIKFYELYDCELIEEVQLPPQYCDTLKIGSNLVVDKLFDTLELGGIIEASFDKKAAMIKDILSYMVIDETSTMQHYPNYAFDHVNHSKNIFNDANISDLLTNYMNESDINTFFSLWSEVNNKDKSITISYDSTNINTSAEGIDFAEYGKAKDNDDLPQVNIGLAANHCDATPLFYDDYPGSIIDNSHCKYMVDKANEYGYKNT